MAKRSREPTTFAGYMHDQKSGIFVVSTCCEGPECTICAGDPAAARRANNPWFPHEPRPDGGLLDG